MSQIIDLSHPIHQKPSCSFGAVDNMPSLSFQEGEAHGVSFITSRIDNLHSNICTHIDFPGHISALGAKFPKPIGMYAVDRFVGTVAVLDVSTKVSKLDTYFDKLGQLAVDVRDERAILNFLGCLSSLAINRDELKECLRLCGRPLTAVVGVLFYTGRSVLWRYNKFESWQYAYFFSPYLTHDACQHLVEARLSFVGVDSFQLEDPIINFNGLELPLALNQSARQFVKERLGSIERFSNHLALLGHDILIYENLRLPPEIRNRLINFHGVPLNMRLEGMNDNALVRPYCTVA